jgi:hypothetical protein
MSVIIQIIGVSNGQPSPFKGKYLLSYNLESNMGEGEVDTTNEPLLALRFRSAKEALATYRSRSIACPFRRWDKRPNRPLTKYSIEIIDLKDLI